MSIAAAVGIGLGAGLLAGMLGVGGGLVLVPGMVLLLNVEQHTAQGVSLAVITVTALAGAVTHYRQQNVVLKVVLGIAPAAVLFGFLGGIVANLIDASLLRRIFGSLTILLGVLLLSGGWPRLWQWIRAMRNRKLGEANCQH